MLMQTTPAFVHLVPIVMLFGIGNVPGVVAFTIFALPPIIRLTIPALTAKKPADLLKRRARSACQPPRQMLFKVQPPLAMPTIMAGVNQTLMLAFDGRHRLMIAVGGRPDGITRHWSSWIWGHNHISVGIAILAIILVRPTQAVGRDQVAAVTVAGITRPAGQSPALSLSNLLPDAR